MPMEAFSVQSLTLISLLRRGRGAIEEPCASHFMWYSCTSRPTNHKFRFPKPLPSGYIHLQGSTKSSTGTVEGISEKTDPKDDNLVFVAAATGRIGSRTVRDLIKLGFRVRAGVQNAQSAGALVHVRKEEEALLGSGLPYTIVRTGCMEQPTDAFKETHNITLSTEDTLFGGQVSNLQIAELMAVIAKNRDLSYCKIVEVIAETTAPLIPAEELLAKIPSQRPYISSPKEPDTAAVSGPDPSSNVVAAKPSVTPQKEAEQPTPVANQPLSPYTVFDDLKPPSSPSPSQSGSGKQTNTDETVSKPIATDTPSSVTGVEVYGISHTKSSSRGEKPLSPYVAYPDLKPPTSPSPNAPTISVSSSAVNGMPEIDRLSSNGPAQLSTAAEPKEGHLPEPKSRPLSPYMMYEDLKPPASPTPSFRKS